MKGADLLTAAAALFCLLLPGGCQTVTADKPVGGSPLALDAEDWAGTWEIPGENAVTVRVVDAAAGTLEFAGIESRDDGFTLEKYQVHLRAEEEWTFVSIIEEGKEGESRYYWGRIVNRDGQVIIAWPPSFEGFRQAVEAGKLTAEVAKDSVHITGLTAKQLGYIVSENPHPLFEWDEPLVLIRIDR